MSTYRVVPVSSISAPQAPLRHAIERGSLDELAASIAQVGVIEPLVVKAAPNGYEVVAGHRRLLAARQCGVATVPVIIRDDDADTARAVMLAENLHRQDLTPVEEARAIVQARDGLGKSIGQIAEMCNRSEAWVRGRIDLLTWPPFALEALVSGNATVSSLRPLMDIENEAERNRLLEVAITSGATSAVTRTWAQQAAGMASMSPETMGARSQLLAPLNSVTVSMPCWSCRVPHDAIGLAVVRICRECVEEVEQQALRAARGADAQTA
jgi:ParB family transcriptional regulator, chromosome partitioning protein